VDTTIDEDEGCCHPTTTAVATSSPRHAMGGGVLVVVGYVSYVSFVLPTPLSRSSIGRNVDLIVVLVVIRHPPRTTTARRGQGGRRQEEEERRGGR
jgi:hypothetical protein